MSDDISLRNKNLRVVCLFDIAIVFVQPSTEGSEDTLPFAEQFLDVRLPLFMIGHA